MRVIPVDESLFLVQLAVVEWYQPFWFSGFRDGTPEYLFNGRVSRRMA